MNRNVISNAVQSEMPPDLKAEAGEPLVINLAPPGEYPQTIDNPDRVGETIEVIQILDEKAIDTLIDNFSDKVLVDADHSSEISTDTKAMAWVTRLFKDPQKGLMAEIEPTSIGAENINGKVYRFVSAAWTLDDDGRPVKLLSIGLTNRPNLPVAPIINSHGSSATDGTGAATFDGGMTSTIPNDVNAGDENDATKANATSDMSQNYNVGDETSAAELTNKGTNQMDKIKEMLGLSPEATEDEVYTAVDELITRTSVVDKVANALGYDPTVNNEELLDALNAVINQCGELQAKNEEAEEARLNAEADQLIAENEDIIPEEIVEEIKVEYIKNPEEAKATVANMRRVYERAILNCASRTEKTPPRVRINNSKSRKTVALNMSEALSSCGGDPAKELEMLRTMYPKH